MSVVAMHTLHRPIAQICNLVKFNRASLKYHPLKCRNTKPECSFDARNYFMEISLIRSKSLRGNFFLKYTF